MSVNLCPLCGGTLEKIRGIAVFESLPNVALHDSDIKCSNPHCGYKVDLATDRYLVRVAVLTTRLQSKLAFTPSELIWSVDSLTICAGHEEKLAQYIGFDNFLTLKKLKIDLKDALWPVDFDTSCCINPFYCEAQSRVAKKFGYDSTRLFLKEVGEAVSINGQMEKGVRMMIELILAPKVPKGKVKMDPKYGIVIHLYY